MFGNDDFMFHNSPRKDTNVELNTEKISIPNVTVNTSDVDTNIASSEPVITLIPKQTSITPPEVPIFKSNVEEYMTSNIPKNLSKKDLHVTMSEGNLKLAINTSTVPPPRPSSPPQTSTIIPTIVLDVSPTFAGIINEKNTLLFSSQSTYYKTPNNEDDEDGEMVGFASLEFNPEEEDVHDSAIMSGKKYKIMNSKLSTIT
ncbi:unnamed protein product [Lactuca saligna]|uniref:Uncharacterized protein n=1 Tax=Lactuca saligna TaxID=75948 RepID=A0AA35YXT2_LACSI|nr:unnamed protein product [Lactuca saligna]